MHATGQEAPLHSLRRPVPFAKHADEKTRGDRSGIAGESTACLATLEHDSRRIVQIVERPVRSPESKLSPHIAAGQQAQTQLRLFARGNSGYVVARQFVRYIPVVVRNARMA